MSEIFTTVFNVVEKVRETSKNCTNKLKGFEARAEDAPTFMSQGITQTLTFYLYKVNDLNNLRTVYCKLFDDKGKCKELKRPNDDICSYLDDEGYVLYTTVFLYLLEKLNVNCKFIDLPNNIVKCIEDISANEAKTYRKLIEYVIELKKVSKIIISQVTS